MNVTKHQAMIFGLTSTASAFGVSPRAEPGSVKSLEHYSGGYLAAAMRYLAPNRVFLHGVDTDRSLGTRYFVHFLQELIGGSCLPRGNPINGDANVQPGRSSPGFS